VDAITRREVRKETWGETHVTVLVDPLRFTLTYEPPDLDLELYGAAGGRLRGASVLSDVD
jgi:hypothetical protein